MEHLEVMIELDAERASEFAAALREKQVEFEGPDRIKSLDGTEMAALIVVVTPVVAPYIIQLAQILVGGKAKLRRGKDLLELDYGTIEQLREFLRVTDEPKPKTTRKRSAHRKG